MPYECLAMGMTPVRAASGVPAGVPGSWWSRTITPDGEVRNSERSVSRNWSTQLGGGNLRNVALSHSHPIGQKPYSSKLTPLGTEPNNEGLLEVAPRRPDVVDPIRSIRTRVSDVTGSQKAGEVVSCAAYHGVPGMARSLPVLAMIPMVLGAGMYWWKRRKGVEKGTAAKYGLATWVASPFTWCLLAPLIPSVRY